MRRASVACVWMTGVMAWAGSALGQLVTPPGDKPAETPTPAVAIVTPEREYKPVGPRPADRSRPLPTLPFESLVERDAQGRVVPLTGDPHRLALQRNPMMDDSTLERLDAAIRERQWRVESVLIANLDKFEDAHRNGFDDLDELDRTSLSSAILMLRPFQEMGTLTNDLQAQGYLSDMQFRFNLQIVQEYQHAKLAEAIDDNARERDGARAQTLMVRIVFGEVLLEAGEAYDHMVREGAGRIDAALAGIEFGVEKAGLAVPIRERARLERGSQAGVEATRELLGMMDLEQRRRFLENVRATR